MSNIIKRTANRTVSEVQALLDEGHSVTVVALDLNDYGEAEFHVPTDQSLRIDATVFHDLSVTGNGKLYLNDCITTTMHTEVDTEFYSGSHLCVYAAMYGTLRLRYCAHVTLAQLHESMDIDKTTNSTLNVLQGGKAGSLGGRSWVFYGHKSLRSDECTLEIDGHQLYVWEWRDFPCRPLPLPYDWLAACLPAILLEIAFED